MNSVNTGVGAPYPEPCVSIVSSPTTQQERTAAGQQHCSLEPQNPTRTQASNSPQRTIPGPKRKICPPAFPFALARRKLQTAPKINLILHKIHSSRPTKSPPEETSIQRNRQTRTLLKTHTTYLPTHTQVAQHGFRSKYLGWISLLLYTTSTPSHWTRPPRPTP